MQIAFTVSGLPPKKRQDYAMWNNDAEVLRIIQLRKAALEARRQAGFAGVPWSSVGLKVKIFLSKKGNNTGDLDTFVAGICDALQAAHQHALNTLHDRFRELCLAEIHPRNPILVENDRNVVSIKAEKVLHQTAPSYYTVVVEGPLS